MKTLLTSIVVFLACVVQGHVVDDLADIAVLEDDSVEPVDEYHKHTILGFEVYVSSRSMNSNPEQTELALWLARSQLAYIDRTLPKHSVDKLRSVKIFLNDEGAELEDSAVCKWACYVSSAQGDGYELTRFHKAVIIRDLDWYAERSAWAQPGLMIHELAHAFHDLFIRDGFANQDIRDAYDDAKESGMYDKVAHIWGDKILGPGGANVPNPAHNTKAYAMTNAIEFFAELSEAIWLRNDYWPFQYYDLFTEDRESFDVIFGSWW